MAEAPTGVAGASCIYILWGLDFGVGVFHGFLLINFGGNELMQGRTLTSQQVD